MCKGKYMYFKFKGNESFLKKTGMELHYVFRYFSVRGYRHDGAPGGYMNNVFWVNIRHAEAR